MVPLLLRSIHLIYIRLSPSTTLTTLLSFFLSSFSMSCTTKRSRSDIAKDFMGHFIKSKARARARKDALLELIDFGALEAHAIGERDVVVVVDHAAQLLMLVVVVAVVL